jgi:hypothetical protein
MRSSSPVTIMRTVKMVTHQGKADRPARAGSHHSGPATKGGFPRPRPPGLAKRVKSLLLGRHHALVLAVTDRQGPFAPVRTS